MTSPLHQKVEKTVFSVQNEIKKEWNWYTRHKKPRKILFDHLPKCGGTTLKSYLASHYPGRKIYAIRGSNPAKDIELFRSFSRSKQHSYHLVTGHLANELIPLVDPNCLSVTLLRDPIERFISFFFYVKRIPHHYIHAQVVGEGMTLSEFTESSISSGARNWLTLHFSGMSQEVGERKPVEAISRAIDACGHYNIVGFLEDYPKFLNQLRKAAGLYNEYSGEKLNVSVGRPEQDDIHHEEIKLIEKANSLDIEFYNRAYEKFSV